MDDLQDLRDLLDPPKALILRIAGVEYEVQPCSAADYLKMQLLLADFQADRNTIPMAEFYKLTLGDALPKLEEGVRRIELSRCAWTAFYWHLEAEEVARKTWAGVVAEESDSGKAEAPTAAPKKKTATRSSSTAGAPTTRSRASGKATKASLTV